MISIKLDVGPCLALMNNRNLLKSSIVHTFCIKQTIITNADELKVYHDMQMPTEHKSAQKASVIHTYNYNNDRQLGDMLDACANMPKK